MVHALKDSLYYFSINRSRLVEQMKKDPFSLSTDGSNDEGLIKLNSLFVRFFDNDLSYVSTLNMLQVMNMFQLFDMCCSKSRTAEILFENIPNVLRSNEIDWPNCVGLSLDNTWVNLG